MELIKEDAWDKLWDEVRISDFQETAIQKKWLTLNETGFMAS
jgi:hypothetical protein